MKSQQYNLESDRRTTEKYLAAYAIKFPTLAKRIPLEKFKNKPFIIIINQITSLIKQDIPINLELFSTFAIPRLVRPDFNEETCSKSLSDLFNLAETLTSELDCNV